MKKLLLASAVTAALFAGHASAATSVKAVPLNANGSVDFSTATGIYAAVTRLMKSGFQALQLRLHFWIKQLSMILLALVYRYVDSTKAAILMSVKRFNTSTFNVVHKRDKVVQSQLLNLHKAR